MPLPALLLSIALLLAVPVQSLLLTGSQAPAVDAGMGPPPPPAMDVGKGSGALGSGPSWRFGAVDTPSRGAAGPAWQPHFEAVPHWTVLAAPQRLLLLGRLLLDGG